MKNILFAVCVLTVAALISCTEKKDDNIYDYSDIDTNQKNDNEVTDYQTKPDYNTSKDDEEFSEEDVEERDDTEIIADDEMDEDIDDLTDDDSEHFPDGTIKNDDDPDPGKVCPNSYGIAQDSDILLIKDCNTIEGQLVIQNYQGTAINGLENLRMIGTEFNIINCPNLTSLSGFKNLEKVGDGMFITGNDALSDLSDLEKLDHIGGWFHVKQNDNMKKISLPVLKYVGKFIVTENDEMTSLDMPSIEESGDYFQIIKNYKLTSISSLK
ncbi:MAG TPA: hypothetical protein PLX56_06625, partial [bacterium]|nr:hypothetical protein [bacterium]